ncbi:DUF3853 family protein [Riemerella columbipharyngis]|uniref:Uncharacterized protein n=1 Tax=Riemerella columbipharyngis TaxID=1071918 RepID=A0A1G6ZDR2_9FLAO|nr:DUF3853 family protein [Riemerella columbipharyngis]SDE00691.1 Protein of unknown function [Riemerella columbipharyngis]
MKDNRPIWQLTVNEFIDIVNSSTSKANNSQLEMELKLSEEKFVYGLDGLAKLLGCSKTTAYKHKKSGLFDPAIRQNGRIIITDKKKALELFDKNKK